MKRPHVTNLDHRAVEAITVMDESIDRIERSMAKSSNQGYLAKIQEDAEFVKEVLEELKHSRAQLNKVLTTDVAQLRKRSFSQCPQCGYEKPLEE